MSGDDAASTDAATGAAATESKQASRQKQAEHRARLRVRQRERVAARLHALIASALAPTVPPPPCARLPMGVCGPHRLINGTTGVITRPPPRCLNPDITDMSCTHRVTLGCVALRMRGSPSNLSAS